jgi:hypothetical protein
LKKSKKQIPADGGDVKPPKTPEDSVCKYWGVMGAH